MNREQNIKSAAILAVILLALLARPISIASAPGPFFFFTDNTLSNTASSDPTEMEQALLNLIDNATSSIDLTIYDFNRDSIRDALIAAHARNVYVRVITDDEVRYETGSYIPYYQALENAGIPVVDDGRPGSIMHNKYFVIDGRYVWTGSTNISDNGFTLNHNNAILLDSSTMADYYQADFYQMFVDGNFSNDKHPGGMENIDYNGIPLELYFSPSDNAMAEIIAEVKSATQSITFAIFYLTFDELRDALIERANAGVEVRGIWDQLGASNAYSDDESLCAAGIPIKIETFAGKMHNKFMVIDADGPNPRIITGSMNWSESGDERNDENTLIIHDYTVSQAYEAEFESFYAALPQESGCNIGKPTNEHVIHLPVVLTGTSETPPPSEIRFVSITYNPPGDDVAGEHAIIENRGIKTQSLSGWRLADFAGAIYTFPAIDLNPGALVIVWIRSGSDALPDLYWGRGQAVWNNDGDTATLTDRTGQTIDVCSYQGGGETAACH